MRLVRIRHDDMWPVFALLYELVGFSGIARTSPWLGHSMGTLRLYELPRKVQKLIGGSEGILTPEFTASQVGSEATYCSEV